MKRVIIVEDQVILTDLLSRVIEVRPFLEISGIYHDGLEGDRAIQNKGADIVILDINLPGKNGLEILRRLKQGMNDPPYAIIFTGQGRSEIIRQAIRIGADSFIEKNSGLDVLEKALDMAESGQPYYSNKALLAIREILANPDVNSPLDILTDRERGVLQLIAESHSTKEIGDRLNLSTGTINTHRWNIMKKLDIHDVAGLTRFAMKYGLVSDGEGS